MLHGIRCINVEIIVSVLQAQHCIVGCNLAVDIYAQGVKGMLTNISQILSFFTTMSPDHTGQFIIQPANISKSNFMTFFKVTHSILI